MNTEPIINVAKKDELYMQFGGIKTTEKRIQKDQINRVKGFAKDNPYLNQVYDEIKNINLTSEKKRLEKIKHLEKLIDYIDDLIININSDTNNRIKALKHEKTRIKKELSKIKKQK